MINPRNHELPLTPRPSEVPSNSEPATINFSELDWADKKIVHMDAFTILHHGNRTGTDGGAGQTAQKGEPIWLTSANDTNAAYGYSGGKFILKYEITKQLNLAVLNSLGNQVFPDEIDSWQSARETFNLDGVLTDYGNIQEICLFDRSKILHIETDVEAFSAKSSHSDAERPTAALVVRPDDKITYSNFLKNPLSEHPLTSLVSSVMPKRMFSEVP